MLLLFEEGDILPEKIKLTFLDLQTNETLLLPVTPSSYEIDHGINNEKISLTELGDIFLPGKRYMMNIVLDCLFPAQKYSFNNEGAIIDPYFYVKKFEDWCDNQAILRFIISETNVNTTCFIESINFSERDGTGDIYAKLKIAQYRVLKNISTQISKDTGNKQRNEDIKKEKTKSYSVVKGDTLSAICRKFYGDANLYNKLAKYNNIKNPHLIFVGQVITIPDKSKL